jgi:hypothetical protein
LPESTLRTTISQLIIHVLCFISSFLSCFARSLARRLAVITNALLGMVHIGASSPPSSPGCTSSIVWLPDLNFGMGASLLSFLLSYANIEAYWPPYRLSDAIIIFAESKFRSRWISNNAQMATAQTAASPEVHATPSKKVGITAVLQMLAFFPGCILAVTFPDMWA